VGLQKNHFSLCESSLKTLPNGAPLQFSLSANNTRIINIYFQQRCYDNIII